MELLQAKMWDKKNCCSCKEIRESKEVQEDWERNCCAREKIKECKEIMENKEIKGCREMKDHEAARYC